MRAHLLSALSRYWQIDSSLICGLQINVLQPCPAINLPLGFNQFKPDWALFCSIDGCILVPSEAVPNTALNRADGWKQVDWWLAAFLMLEGWHERLWEHQHGPIHSYSIRLPSWDQRAWQYAWVNRIALFLRQWAIHCNGPKAEHQLGPLPAAEISMTHDVDALRKLYQFVLSRELSISLIPSVHSVKSSLLRPVNACDKPPVFFLVVKIGGSLIV